MTKIFFGDFTEITHGQMKGRGQAPNRSAVMRRLEEIKEHVKKTGSRSAFPVGEWGIHETACGVARAITRANTENQKPGDQKCPSGRWAASVRKAEEGTIVIVQFLGEEFNSKGSK
jgi:hypothetical protein